MPQIFWGGNRLFLFLPPNLHFISSSASSLSFSEALSPKRPPSFALSLTTRLSTQHHHRRHALTSLLTPTHCSHFLILFLVFVLSLPSSKLFFFFFFFPSSTCNLGLSSLCCSPTLLSVYGWRALSALLCC